MKKNGKGSFLAVLWWVIACLCLGVLLLLLIDGREEECAALQAFNRTVNLPTCLQDASITLDQVERSIPEILADADLEHLPYRITGEMIMEAARKLDKLV